jgi:putative transposase
MRQRHTLLDFAGSIHFVTTVTRASGNWFSGAPVCRAVLETFEGYRSKFGIECLGYVLMPDHLHALLHQPTEESSVSKMMEGFKSVTSRTCRPTDYPLPNLWHDRYDDVAIPGRDAALTRMNYMHNNPVRNGIATLPEEYVWSSARELVLHHKGLVVLTAL